MFKIIIISMPRSGSSLLAQLLASSGIYKPFQSPFLNSTLQGPSEFNEGGYMEDVYLSLLNDQIIRMKFGLDYSFLHIPSFDNYYSLWGKEASPNYKYDYDENTVYLPENYEHNPGKYTGKNWDVWGLTRMLKSGDKWYECYSKHFIQTSAGIEHGAEKISNLLNSSNENLIIKDPRLALTLSYFNIKDYKLVFIRRRPFQVYQSMRRHYGNFMFSSLTPFNNKLCSNHFNYKVKYQNFDYYYHTYNLFCQYLIALNPKNSLVVNYEDLIRKDEDTMFYLNGLVSPSNNKLIDWNLIKEK